MAKGKVGVVGLGIRGGAFAKNLVADGWRVMGYDIDPARRRAMARAGVELAPDVKTLAADVFQHIEVTDGRVWLKRSGIGFFCGDLPEAEQKLVYATQGAPVADLFNQKVEGTAWKTKPSWYIVATQDRTVNPELQRFATKRMKAATTEVTSSHVPMLSKPDVVLDVIRKAASAVPSP